MDGARSLLARLGLPPGALSGRVAVITGAGQGIGREAARMMAALGARVVIADIAVTGAETEQAIRDGGGEALFVRTDVSDQAAVINLAARTVEAFGPADILVNNAIVSPVATVVDLDLATWDQTIAVNLRGAFLTCKAFLPPMLATGRGVVINMVSTDAMANMAAYIASKQGLAGFSQSLAAEVGEQGVRVIALAPGFVGTPGLRQVAERLAPVMGLTPEEFVNMPLHAAYPGAMPVEDAGAATAYLAALLADELHGEVVTGYQVLERAGYLKPASGDAGQGATPREAPATEPGEALTRALALSSQLADVVKAIEGELGRLPVFVRPLARSGFKQKAGQSLQDWSRTAAGLHERLQAAGTGGEAALAGLWDQVTLLREQLRRLARYCEEVPAETGRFTKDEAFLADVRRIAGERLATISALVAALEELAEGRKIRQREGTGDV